MFGGMPRGFVSSLGTLMLVQQILLAALLADACLVVAGVGLVPSVVESFAGAGRLVLASRTAGMAIGRPSDTVLSR